MKSLLDRIFIEAGKDSADYLDFVRLDPMYELRYDDEIFRACNNTEDTKAEIERLFPGHSGAMDVFLKKEKARFKKLLLLQRLRAFDRLVQDSKERRVKTPASILLIGLHHIHHAGNAIWRNETISRIKATPTMIVVTIRSSSVSLP